MQRRQEGKRKATVAHTVRTADGLHIELRLTRKLAMACMCTECLGFEDNPADCTAHLCPLYPFRAKTLVTRRGAKPGAAAKDAA